MRRSLQRLDGDTLDAVLGGQAARRADQPGKRWAVAVDGKTVRGSRGADTAARCLMAAIDHRAGVALGQVNVVGKTNQIPMFSPLRPDRRPGRSGGGRGRHALPEGPRRLSGAAARCVLTVKGNQSALRDQLKALPWKDVPVGHTSSSRGHGRVEKRALKAVAVSTGILFPHVAQAIQITRQTRKLNGRTWRTEVVYAITNLSAAQAAAAHLAAFIRGHWRVENRLHWVRDVTFDEDRSQIRIDNGPRVMASPIGPASSATEIGQIVDVDGPPSSRHRVPASVGP